MSSKNDILIGEAMKSDATTLLKIYLRMDKINGLQEF